MKNGIDEQYLDLIKDILENGVEKDTRNGKTLSVFGRTIRYKFKGEKIPLLTTKKMAWKSIISELCWFLKGRTDLRYLLENNCHIWTGDAYQIYKKDFESGKFEGESILNEKEFENKIISDNSFNQKYGNFGPIYGKQWRAWKQKDILEWGYKEGEVSIDQIANLINDLKTNPDSRRLMVNSWNQSEIPSMLLPPCHYGFQVYTRELSLNERGELFRKTYQNKSIDDFKPNGMEIQSMKHQLSIRYDNANIPKRAISLMFNMRSTDVGLGLGFNLASYGVLLMLIAKQVNMVPDELIYIGGDVHLYQNHIDPIQDQLEREPYELPTLKLSDKEIKDLSEYEVEDFILENYKSHPAIKLPLSN
jgi:thymidylate synthase